MAHYKQGNDKQGKFVAVIPEERITDGSFEATVSLYDAGIKVECYD
ncbi:hypothetical protein TERTU_0793 [Teredinibacter turnerae T7901]|uniref:Uncharacterized protein n=1 Tax=Teredinibacter turnerae (strain ATCC 39867 / T7901) TaxID=377629 RepID=C5BPH8_TERTT|nr:hypothetical protein TERTU_0793 [Teredinibacter turnerae T7901]